MLTNFVTLFLAVLLVVGSSYAQNYVAEGLFVVDEATVQKYVQEISGAQSSTSVRDQAVAELKGDIEYVLTEVNQLFSSLASNGLSVQIRIKDISILTENIFSTDDYRSPGVVNDRSGLDTFASWLGTQSYGSPDFAILWTGLDLYGQTGRNLASFSKLGGVCDQNRNQGVVEFNTTYSTVIHTANAISFLLGASQDGAASSNVLAYTHIPADENRWDFSACSASDMIEYFGLLSPNCLLTTSASSKTPSSTWASYSGKFFDADTVCQRAKSDTRSYMCKSKNIYPLGPPQGDEVCQMIYCKRTGTDYCDPAYPADGMICGNSKRCENGKCVPDTSAASRTVDDSCVFGDQPAIGFNNPSYSGTCEDFVNNFHGKRACYSQTVKNLCCSTCGSVRTNIPGCEYGDRSAQCVQYTREQICPNNMDVCCEYCNGFKRKRSASFGEHHVVLPKKFEHLVEHEFAAKKSKKEMEDE